MDINTIIDDIDHQIAGRQLTLAKVKKDYANSEGETKELYSIAMTLIATTIETFNNIRTDLLTLKAKQNV